MPAKLTLICEPPHDDISEFNLCFSHWLRISIKLNVTRFVGKENVADKFNIKCRYLKADEKIDNKAKKIHKQIFS
ncbi:hypothetical protein RhiirA1_484793 [Rhizophagus irregularis]|uniref:Uncharacterized protein n=1 Tax=Rhizophagus irregularis TaxID=588596 RepID=A0A2N0QIX3_9GLOM|nr:hypothetical protein RhiirA1_484793 [Rhizophagus irregularis]